MNRLDAIFRSLRAAHRKALMPFITAGDPDLATTAALLPALQRAGASICELGIPFSDPIADGPVIQDSMTHALAHGFHPRQVFDMVAAQRQSLGLGVVMMVSYSIVHKHNPETFVRDAAAAGIDGFILPDLPIEESAPIRALTTKANLSCSFLIAPTTPLPRARDIARACSGFVYVLARAGITGERSALPPDLSDRLTQIREATDLPIAVGFGVSTPDHVRQVVSVADAAIVGSAIVRRLAATRTAGQPAVVAAVESFTRDLATGLAAG